jgi:hypothetical protein
VFIPSATTVRMKNSPTLGAEIAHLSLFTLLAVLFYPPSIVCRVKLGMSTRSRQSPRTPSPDLERTAGRASALAKKNRCYFQYVTLAITSLCWLSPGFRDAARTPLCLTFRTLRTRYCARYTVSFFEGVLLHLADETPELTMVVDPLLAETCLILG